MADSNTCPQCGVPKYISSEHLWLDNGDIVHSRDQRRRLVFIESENIDPLLQEVESLIGVSIERIVIDCVKKNVLLPLSAFVPEDLKEKVRRGETDYRSFMDTFILISSSMGRGKLELKDLRYQRDGNDFCVFRITEPFSLPLNCGARAAGIEAILGYPQDVTYKKVGEQVYEITVFPSQHTKRQEDRMLPEDYRHQPGTARLERCPACGVPKALSECQWNQERGVILNKSTQRRMVMFSPRELDPVFQELEKELGEAIPRLVVEAQRRIAKSGFYSLGDVNDLENLRDQFALRGLGCLRSSSLSETGMSIRLDNAVLHLMVVGMMQGLFELTTGLPSIVEWKIDGEDNLEIEINV